MSVFDLFRGFLGVPGGLHHGRRDPFFDAMVREEDDDDDDDDDDEEQGHGDHQQDPFDSALRFGFSLGPDGMRAHEPRVFGQILKEMEEIFAHMSQPGSGLFGIPELMPPPSQDGVEGGGGGGGGGQSSGNPLRDSMLKSSDQGRQQGPLREPRQDGLPFFNFHDGWRKSPEDVRKEDGDLDSEVSSGGLDQILTPPAGQAPSQPRVSGHPFFRSVTVIRTVRPDGTVEERRTVSDGKGHTETTETRSGGAGSSEGPDHPRGPALPGGPRAFSDLRDDDSLFSKFFGGFK